LKETLTIINAMQRDGVIGKYAIGGAVGATLYLEPAATLDVDIFVMLPQIPDTVLVSLSPIYEYLKANGCTEKDEHVVIGGWPVQFLLPSDELESEAVANATTATVEDITTWVMQAEYLVAIALRTGRIKDYARIVQFLGQGAVDRGKLMTLIEKHGLTARWVRFEERYLEDVHE
jgi:hypothetical protein